MQINAGRTLIRKNTKLPQQVFIKGEPVNREWLLLDDEVHAFEKKIRNAAWHFFWITDCACGWAIGHDRQSSMMVALVRALRKIKKRYSAAEISAIEDKAFLGVHLCRVHLATRHVQAEGILGLSPNVGMISPALITAEDSIARKDMEEQIAA
ncbi:MAG: hypothetical protein RB191_10335 [Terriglobia bacterium]|nr:hypothetical protein [Terriglobia bacterium]